MSRADRLVTRAQWGARAPQGRMSFAPSFGTTGHYSEVAAAANHLSCASQVRAIQDYHMDHHGWSDIAYSDLACQHGWVFEGRGRGWRTAANGTNDGNDRAHAVCALLAAGQSPTSALIDAMVDSAIWLNTPTGYGDDWNVHSDWKPTGCPGDPLRSAKASMRQRILAGLNPAPAPVPPTIPAPWWGPSFPEDNVRNLNLAIATDSGGRGYADISVDRSAVFAVLPQGDQPADGWSGVGVKEPPYAISAGAGKTRVVVPASNVVNGRVDVTVACAG